MKAKKLPSGSWRCRVYDYTDSEGKKHYKSFTVADPSAKGKRKCEYMAAEFADSKNLAKQGTTTITLREAVASYIESRNNILSPATIRSYDNMIEKNFPSLLDMNIYDITQGDVQSAINRIASKYSPKTVRNKHGLLSAVLKMYRPEFALNTALPQKQKPNLHIPTDDEVKQLIVYTKEHDTDMFRAILLAAFGPMRRGEICALKSSDIDKNTVHVQHSMVRNKQNQWVIKGTKSTAGDRFIPFPDFVIKELDLSKDSIIDLKPDHITMHFVRILKKMELPHFRFHDLRHYCASIQHAMGIPDAYIMQRGGWGSDTVLKNVYRHALKDKSDEMNDIANEHFSRLYDTKYDTNF